uniref:Doublecortin domain containing 2C n=1 Tax=Naja naja TaxID=35670 RepID=A0A8C6XP61_NAJNA
MVGTPRAMHSLTDSTPARTIWVYRNGDPFYLGRKFIINPRYVPTFEAFMIQLNEGVPTPFGVRKLYTPSQGHTITDLPELRQGGRYVVAGREKFRKLNCAAMWGKHDLAFKILEFLCLLQIRPVVHSNIKVPSKWQSIYNKPRNINVFTNGDLLIPPMKILIPKFTLNNWNGVLALVNEKVIPRSGGIHRLFTLNGQPVDGPDKLEDNQFYIACGKEKFQHLPYWQHPKVPENIRRLHVCMPEPRRQCMLAPHVPCTCAGDPPRCISAHACVTPTPCVCACVLDPHAHCASLHACKTPMLHISAHACVSPMHPLHCMHAHQTPDNQLSVAVRALMHSRALLSDLSHAGRSGSACHFQHACHRFAITDLGYIVPISHMIIG